MSSIPHHRTASPNVVASASTLFAVLLAAAGARLGVFAYAFERLADRGETDLAAWGMLAVHTFGTLLFVGLALALSRPGMLTGLAFACYSTVAVGLNAPNALVGGVVWATGFVLVLAIAGLLMTAPRPPSRRAITIGSGMGVVLGLAVVVPSLL